MKHQKTFYSYYTFWKSSRWHYEISTNFNLELYVKYLKTINERINK